MECLSLSENRGVRLEGSWKKKLQAEFNKEYMLKLSKFLRREKACHKVIYPEGKNIFNAFSLTPFDQVKVVIIGQDPYHNPNQAHGLSFSVQQPVPPPPSLKNIFKELRANFGLDGFKHGDLTKWAQQGVLLLNAILTVEKNRPSSHKNQGWEDFTDRVIKVLDENKENLVFMLWGQYAQKKGSQISSHKHCVLKAPHPSPFSANRGFLGCSHFMEANAYLQRKNQDPIDWSL